MWLFILLLIVTDTGLILVTRQEEFFHLQHLTHFRKKAALLQEEIAAPQLALA